MPKKKKLTYQEAIAEIEEIHEWIQRTELTDIDALIEKTKRAKELLDFCQSKLSEGETIIQEIFSNSSETS